MNKTTVGWAVLALGLLALAGFVFLSRKQPPPPAPAPQVQKPTSRVQKPPPAGLPNPGPRIFYFSPPEGFSDENLIWQNYHYVAHVGLRGVEREGLVRVEGEVMNFSQSAYDPTTDTLYTWKKNYRPFADYIMRLSASETGCQPLTAIPRVGSYIPLLAVDSRRHRILVAEKAGLAGFDGSPEFNLYDIGTGRWQTGRFADVRLITLDYYEPDDVFVGLGWKLPPEGTPWTALIRISPSGSEVSSVPVHIDAALKRPASGFPARYQLPNHPGIQSRIIDNTIVVMRYCDFGKPTLTAPFAWTYEVYHVDVDTGAMEFASDFK